MSRRNSHSWDLYFSTYSVSNLQFFSWDLLLPSSNIATPKYIYCPNYQLSKVLNLTFNFESYLPNRGEMAAIFIFSDICRKGILFTSYFVNSFLLSIYFSKYLQFLLNTITNCKNYVTEHVFLQVNAGWNDNFFPQILFSQFW